MSEFSVDKIVEVIEEKRRKNREEFDRIYKQADRLIEAGKSRKTEKLTSQDVLGYYPVYAKAEKKEKAGDLKGAAKLYWQNIFVNGTDAPVNFKRLLVVLKKLEETEDELKVAKVYLHFVEESGKLEKRIRGLQKKLGPKS